MGRFDQSFFHVWGRFDQFGDVLTRGRFDLHPILGCILLFVGVRACAHVYVCVRACVRACVCVSHCHVCFLHPCGHLFGKG